MPVRILRPLTNGQRNSSVDTFEDITRTEPEKSLVRGMRKKGGRNNQGRITTRHHGGGAKRLYRMVDFKQAKYDVSATVKSIEYDPSRTCRIAMIHYIDGNKSYILAPQEMKVGDKVVSSQKPVEVKPGNRTRLENIPIGMFIYNIELFPGKGGQVVRSAGLAAQLLAIEGKFAQLRLPSKEVRMVAKECLASIGSVSNPDSRLIRYGKAGRFRHLGIRPRVVGKAMNPVDHPHGGGEGHNPIGHKRPLTPWGKPALGVKTRKKKKASWRMILKRRK
ncbi:50S ribosomal protein L2 [Candidatus Uhrbacteria bacterium]|nr:50S ribosomal protein L2 [Candidatus Uhrbacteria bacterium]